MIARLSGSLRSLKNRAWEIPAIMLLLTGAALLLRLVNLTSIPPGLHGDEAIVGMEGQRILREIVIDPYSPSALGQPTAPFYLPALTVWIWDNTVLAVRLSAVIFGTLAIPALFFVVRRFLGTSTGVLAASLLALMGWHIHYSRIAFPLPAWPLWVILTVGALSYAAQTGSRIWWGVAGVMAASGIYVYNAHPLTLGILGLFALIWLVREHRHSGRATYQRGAVFTGAILLSLVPMFWFIVNNTQMYWNSVNRHSVRDTAQWQNLRGPIEQIEFILLEYGRFWWHLSFSPQIDYVDATGITEVVPTVLLVLAAVGLFIACARFRTPLVWVGAMLVLLTPFATVLTEQGEMRRTFVIAPFLAMFIAIGVLESVRFLRIRAGAALTWVGVGLIVVVTVIGVGADLRNYYLVQAGSPTQRWIFAEEFYEASMFIQQLDDEQYVYFMSERWSFDYVPRRFLAPEAQGEDRSDEFGQFGLDVSTEQGAPVFVLVGDYRPAIDALQQRYPDGEIVTGSDESEPAFIAYILAEESD
jgi:4-amino-4-deoxy-L-arabinose transferase-like glycosyltransferase